MASNDNQPPNGPDNGSRNRRGSVTSAALSNLFRSNSTSTAATGTPVFPGPITSAALDPNRRRLSITTTAILGLGNSPASAGANSSGGVGASAFAMRRASMSTNSSTSDNAIDENAIEDDDAPPGASRTTPNTPYGRRTSFGAQAMRNLGRPGGTSPGGASSNDQGYNWPEQLRSRAESSVASGARPSFSFASGTGNSPPRGSGFASASGFGGGGGGGGGGGIGNGGGVGSRHDRAKSVSDVPVPVAARQPPQPRRDTRAKPDHFQERILKGDFYMD